jgi:hypothetical protein
MKPSRSYIVRVVTSGFIILLLLSIPLFWARLYCEIALRRLMPAQARSVRIEPSGLVPKEIENDPNVARHSFVLASFYPPGDPRILGIGDYFMARAPRGHLSSLYYYAYEDERHNEMLYFDKNIGLFVYHVTDGQRMPGKTTVLRKIYLYAGPNGVSQTPDKALGRFSNPIANTAEWSRPPVLLFDKGARRFFNINFREKTVTKGPKLGKDSSHNPVQIDSLTKIWSPLHLEWQPPMPKVLKPPPDENEDQGRRSRITGRPRYKSIIEYFSAPFADQYVLVLDESGRIDLLNRKTLEFAGIAGYLPAPKTLFPSKTSVKPKDLLGYRVVPMALGDDGKYRGICVATISREGTALALAVFDDKRRGIRQAHTRAKDPKRPWSEHTPSSKAVFFHAPWAPTLTTAKYLLENLHPPILSIASYLTADSVEAAAGHRALFILPNSFVAMKAREVGKKAMDKFNYALLRILPSIGLGIFLAWRVTKDAKLVGLSENAKLCWIIGTIAFGLTAYITYRLTRPKITLVTCLNCGRLRRPDMAKCHHCSCKWLIPELTPPAWRVAD